MKKLCAVLLVLGSVGTSWGRQPVPAPSAISPVGLEVGDLSPQPTPAVPLQAVPEVVQTSHQIVPVPEQPGMILGNVPAYPVVPLYPTVVRKQRNIHPCAVQKIVSVPDPCDPCRCVCIAICVPPCACERVSVSRRGDRVNFHYGKYEVDVTARRGKLIVSYED